MKRTYVMDISQVACAVPLLDMKCFNKLLAGASWMAEYGDPDTDDWMNFLHRYSPYHNIDPKRCIAPTPDRVDGKSVAPYPALFMSTSTRDDRVHPYHARCFVKRLEEVSCLDVVHDAPLTYGVYSTIYRYVVGDAVRPSVVL